GANGNADVPSSHAAGRANSGMVGSGDLLCAPNFAGRQITACQPLVSQRSCSTFPVVARHDSAHEFIEQRDGESCITVTRTPNHALCDQLTSRRAEGSHLSAQLVRNDARPMRTRSELRHGAKVFLFQRRQTVETNAEETFV